MDDNLRVQTVALFNCGGKARLNRSEESTSPSDLCTERQPSLLEKKSRAWTIFATLQSLLPAHRLSLRSPQGTYACRPYADYIKASEDEVRVCASNSPKYSGSGRQPFGSTGGMSLIAMSEIVLDQGKIASRM